MKRISKIFLSLTVILIFILLAMGSTGNDTPEKVDSTTPVSETEKASLEDTEELLKEELTDEELDFEGLKVGDTVRMGEYLVTLNSVRSDKGSEYWGPEEGELWLTLDISIINESEKEETISSMLMFELYDENHYQANNAFMAETKGSLDGSIGAGRTMRGEIAFNVEADTTYWEFIFMPGFLRTGQAIFDIYASDIQ